MTGMNHVHDAEAIIKEGIERYGADGLCVCFNGGKDCTALLHMVASLLPVGEPLNALLVIDDDETFPEVDAFVSDSLSMYPTLRLIRINGPIKTALKTFRKDYPKIHAAFMGIRRTDPCAAELSVFSMTDEGWPELMRILPMLDWSYDDVWSYLRERHVPYCSLYDRGYTSLGGRDDTIPNPALADVTAPNGYRPAHTLRVGEKEREGRCVSPYAL